MAIVIAFFSLLDNPPRHSHSISIVQRLQISNQGESVVNIENLQLRVPFGTSDVLVEGGGSFLNGHASWFYFPLMVLPPYSQQVISISISGKQTYPDLPMLLLSQMEADKYSHQILPPLKNVNKDFQMLIDWVHSELEYKGFQAEALTLPELLQKKVGDCTEFTLLAYHKMKASGFRNIIPVEGYFIPNEGSKIVSGSNSHAWLLVEKDNQWWVVDPLYKRITKPNSEYLVLNILEEAKALPRILNSKLPVAFI